MAEETKSDSDFVRSSTGIVRPPLELPFSEVGFEQIHSYPRHRCDLSAVGFARETGVRPYTFDARKRHDGCLFQYTLGGEGRFQSTPKEKPIVVQRGMAILVPFPSPVRYWLAKGAEWEFCYITLDGDMTRDLFRLLIRKYGHVWNIPPADAAVDMIRDLHRRILNKRIPDEFESANIAHRFLMALFHFQLKPEHARSEPVERVIRLVERDYRDTNLDVIRIATEAGYSRYHLSRLFRREMGIGPYAYLQQIRLQHALDLVANTELPLKQIAFDCGYSNYVHFCSEFKRRTHRTAGMIRRIGSEFNLNEIHTR